MYVGIHPAMHLYVSQLGCDCTCARARRAMFHVHVQCSRFRERLDRLRSNLVYRWGSVRRVAYKSKLGPTLHVRTCRVTVPDLKNVWTDCAQIWHTVRDRLVGCRAQIIGGTPAQFRTCKAHYLVSSVGRPKRRYTGYCIPLVYIYNYSL